MEKGALRETYHFSSQTEIVIRDLYYLIARLMDRNAEPIWNAAPRKNEISRQLGDSSKARRDLDWEPKVPLEEGLKLTIAWWKNHPELWRTSDEESLEWERLHTFQKRGTSA